MHHVGSACSGSMVLTDLFVGGGCKLFTGFKYLGAALIKATVEAVTIPVTVKMRLGWDHASMNAPELAKRAEKLGVKLIEKNLTYKLDCSEHQLPRKISIETYEDHRMAMAFAPLALIIDEVEILDPEVVNKSYPHFWEDLKRAGFEIKE